MSLSGWNKDNIIQLTIDKEKVGEVLTDFPVLVNLTVSGSGQNSYDCTPLFTELEYPTRKKIAIEYKGVQEHWVESVDDDFTGTNGDDPNTDLWDITDGTPIITNNSLDLSYDNTSGGAATNTQVDSIYNISGDFDIQIDFKDIDFTGTGAGDQPVLYIYFFVDLSWYSRVGISAYESDTTLLYQGLNRIDGTSYYSQPGTTDTSGKFRLTRIGNVITSYKWSGSSWDTLQSDSGCTTSDGKIMLKSTQHVGVNFTGYFDNFKVNYGTIDWLGNTPIKEFRSYYVDRQQCYVEIENWDQVNQEAQFWVKIPHVLPDQPTDLFLYYDSTQDDNTSYVGDIGDWEAQQVWDNNFVAVYHMNQIPGGANSVKDSTSNNLHGTPEGSMDSDDLVNGFIGKALDFDGTNDTIDFGSSSLLSLSEMTVETTFKWESVHPDDVYRSILSKCTDPSSSGYDDNYHIYVSDSTFKIGVRIGDGVSSAIIFSGNSVVNDSQYHNLGFYFSSSGGDGGLFVDGIDNDPQTGLSACATGFNDSLRIGRWDNNGTNYGEWDGIIDEVRISNIARNNSWLRATNYSNNDDLITFETPIAYTYAGYVRQLGEPVQRTVCLYERNSGELMDKIVSNETGYYSLYTTSSGLHNVMCFDADIEPDYDDLLISKIVPTEVL